MSRHWSERQWRTRVVGEHRRVFGRGKTVYDPWHYVPVLARKPGALRSELMRWMPPPAASRIP
jgi:hypothetical protein